MINRVLIRLKIVQIVYAYYQNGGKNLDTAEKELFFSLSKAYDMYNYLLLLMVEITKQAEKKQSAAKNKLLPTAEELYPNTKFVDNRFIAQLEVNKQLLEFSESQKKTWENESEFVKRLCEKIMDKSLLVRRIQLTANHVMPEGHAQNIPRQLDLFTDPAELDREDAALERERRRQKAVLTIKRRYGKNAILRGMNFKDGATARERNAQVGGHKA